MIVFKKPSAMNKKLYKKMFVIASKAKQSRLLKLEKNWIAASLRSSQRSILLASPGFTLIETLISLLLSSIAILGFYTLQIKDQQLLTDNLIQNTAQMQILNSRELILSNPNGSQSNIQKILSLSNPKETNKTEIHYLAPRQILLSTYWKSHLQTENESEKKFSLHIII
jgi:prepilin-type N-terminal cleavage/methylation domain-containing protein